jgi:hypothetical protein
MYTDNTDNDSIADLVDTVELLIQDPVDDEYDDVPFIEDLS